LEIQKEYGEVDAVQAIKFDNDKEYTSLEFNLYYEDAINEHQLIAPHILEQNEVSERRNRYIMEMVRCMLEEFAQDFLGRSS
jgi:hypothetical protein